METTDQRLVPLYKRMGFSFYLHIKPQKMWYYTLENMNLFSQEFLLKSIPYQCNPSLLDAITSHFKFLRIRSSQGLAVEYLEM